MSCAITLQASTSARMAPHTAFVDAFTASTLAAGNWHQTEIQWNFGDDRHLSVSDPVAGNTAYPNDCHRGFNAAYPYDSAGTYTITLSLKDRDGTIQTASTTVTVTADTRTAYYFDGTSGDDSLGDGSIGNPYQTWVKAMTLAATNVKLLFKAGTAFTVSANKTLNNVQNLWITSYGTGATPTLTWTGSNPGSNTYIFLFSDSGGRCENIFIENLSVLSNQAVATSNQSFSQDQHAIALTFRSITINGDDAANAMNQGWSHNYTASFAQTDGVLLINCTSGDLRTYTNVGIANSLVAIGNSFGSSRDESTFRSLSQAVAMGVSISYSTHNYANHLGHGSPYKDTVRFGWVNYAYVGRCQLLQGVIEIGFETSSPAPGFSQDQDYTIFEECYCSNATAGLFLIAPRTDYCTVRNCFWDLINSSASCFSPQDSDPANYSGTTPASTNILVYNNTIRRRSNQRYWQAWQSNALQQAGQLQVWSFNNNRLLTPGTGYASPYDTAYAVQYLHIAEEATIGEIKNNVFEDQGASYNVMQRHIIGGGTANYTLAALNALTGCSGNVLEDADPATYDPNPYRPPSTQAVTIAAAAVQAGVFRDLTGNPRALSGTWYAGCTDALPIALRPMDQPDAALLRWLRTLNAPQRVEMTLMPQMPTSSDQKKSVYRRTFTVDITVYEHLDRPNNATGT